MRKIELSQEPPDSGTDLPIGYSRLPGKPTACYRRGDLLVVVGDPGDDDDEHSCDAMGCGQDHVLVRGRCY